MACERPVIATYVFMDLETTGLPGIGERPRIVEISMVAVQCKALSEKSRSSPRVIDKLVICLNPCNKPMSHGASMITGLYNDELEGLSVFDEDTVHLLQLFLSRLPAPVCLLAHNGDRFDFPMLKMELEKINISLPGDLFCADTLRGLRFVELGYSDYQKAIVKPELSVNISIDNNEITPVKTSDSTPTGLHSTCATNDDPPPTPRKKRNLSGTRNVGGKKSARRKLLQGGELCCDENNADGDGGLNQSFSQTPPPETERQTGLPPRKLTFESRDHNLGDQHTKTSQNSSSRNTSAQINNDGQLLPFPTELFEDDLLENDASRAEECRGLSLKTDSNSDQTKTSDDQFTDSLPIEDLVAAVEKFSNESGNSGRLLQTESVAVSVMAGTSDGTKGGNHVDILSKSPNQIPSTETYVGQLTPTKSKETEIYEQSVSTKKEAKHRANEITASKVSTSANQNLYFSPSEKTPVFTPTRKSFKLPDIYKRYFGGFPEVSHAAEDDCITLLKIVQACASKFAPWVEQNAKPFSEIEKMY